MEQTERKTQELPFLAHAQNREEQTPTCGPSFVSLAPLIPNPCQEAFETKELEAFQMEDRVLAGRKHAGKVKGQKLHLICSQKELLIIYERCQLTP